MNDSQVRSETPPLFGEFLLFLREQGFAIGLDHYWRVYELAEKLGGACRPEEVKTVLCPIFATSKSEQEQFYRAFDAFFGPSKSTAVNRAPADRAPEKTRPELSKRGLAAVRPFVRALAVLFLVAGAVILWQSNILNQPGQQTIDLISPPDPSLTFLERHFKLILLALSSLVCFLFLVYEWHRSRRQALILQKREGHMPPYTWPVRINSHSPVSYDTEEFFAASRVLRRREVGDYCYLDIPATISATIRNADYPTLQYKPHAKTPEHLALIKRASLRDHQADLYNHLMSRMEEAGVYIRRYFYDDDPRICFGGAAQESVTLERLRGRFPEHRLIIFSNGDEMFDPLTGRPHEWCAAFSDWKLRILLTPRPASLWGARESILSRHFVVIPATVGGLLSLADLLESGQRPGVVGRLQADDDPPADAHDPAEMVERLRQYLGEELFQWLCACAYIPELRWELTLYLGAALLGDYALTEANLLKLGSLPWFQEGSIPDDYLELLRKALDEERARAVESVVTQLFEKNLPPRHSAEPGSHLLDVEVVWPADFMTPWAGAASPPPGSGRAHTVLMKLKKALLSSRDIVLSPALYRKLKSYAASGGSAGGAGRPQPKPGQAKAARNVSSEDVHPKGLYVLFAVEGIERFGFYSMLAMFALYIRDNTGQGFGWSVDDTQALVSNYLLLVYFAPLVGGLVGDKKLGYRKSVMLGGIFFTVGYLLLSFRSIGIVYAALACLVVGNGLLKPNVSAMVGNLYPEGSHLKDRAYSIFYMGINVGAFLAPIVMEIVQSKFGYHPAFAVAAGAMAISLLILWRTKRHVEIAERPANRDVKRTAKVAAVTSDVPPASISRQDPLDAVSERRRVGALIVIFLIVVVFWMVFHQNSTTITYWADENTDWKVSGIASNSINPFWVILLTFPLVWFWGWLDRRGREPSTPTKMVIGMMTTAVAFLILFVAAKSGEASLVPGTGPYDYRVSPAWLLGAYGVLTLGELMLSPMGLSLVSKVAPVRMRGLMMGGWFVATAIGNKLTQIGQLWDDWLHSTFWIFLSACAVGVALLLLLILRPLKKAMPGV